MTRLRTRLLVAPVSAPYHSLRDRSITGAQERREVLESIFEELRNPRGDADSREACAALLQHLARS